MAEAKELGDRILLVATSTGGTLALDYVARYPDEAVVGLVLYSPNVAIASASARLVNGPWGLEMLRSVNGGDIRVLTGLPAECTYIWTDRYRIEGIVAVEELLERTMTAQTFSAVTLPTMVAYYYRDEEHQDDIVSVEAIREMVKQLGTPEHQLREHALAEVSGHVITSDCRTTGLDRVRQVSYEFVEQVLAWEPN